MKLINRFLFLVFTSLSCFTAFAQEEAAAAATVVSQPSSRQIAFDANTMLTVTVAVLLLVIVFLAFMLKSSIDLYRDDYLQTKRAARTSNKTGTLILIFLFAGIGSVYAQETGDAPVAVSAPVTASQFNSKMITFILLTAIAIELFVIFYLIKWIKFFTGIQAFEERKRLERQQEQGFEKGGSFRAWWRKINKLRPIREEHELEIGHEYDGIKELDNATPPWFTVAFLATIVFGIGYIWYYNTSGPTQEEEYVRAMEKAEAELHIIMAAQGDQVDENTVTLLDASGINAGKEIFKINCASCHGPEGEGGIGPNLSDSYSLHGASINEVFHTVKYGVPDKGMQSWKSQLTAQQIAEVSSYIVSIQGTNVPGGKEPQGAPFSSTKAETPSTSPDSTGVPDNISAVGDSAKVAALK